MLQCVAVCCSVFFTVARHRWCALMVIITGPCCSMLHCVAEYCVIVRCGVLCCNAFQSTLQCVAMCCSVLQCIAYSDAASLVCIDGDNNRSVLHCVALCFAVLQSIVLKCGVVCCVAVRCGHVAVCCSML